MDEIYYYIIVTILVILLLAYLFFHKQINLLIVSLTGAKRMQKKLYKDCKINDLLILNDIYLPIGDDKFKHIDTIIFGNKYIYIVKIIKQAGIVYVASDDSKWRVVYDNNLNIIDNPFMQSKKIISYLTKIVNGIENKDLKSLAVFSQTCKIEIENKYDDELVATELNAIKTIMSYEKESNEDIFDPKEIERYCDAFYTQGKKAEKVVKRLRRK